MSCKCNNVSSQRQAQLFVSNPRTSSRISSVNSENNTCGREIATSCNNFDCVPTRIYNSDGITSCVYPSFGSGCSSCSSNCGCGTRSSNCGCGTRSSNCGCGTCSSNCGCGTRSSNLRRSTQTNGCGCGYNTSNIASSSCFNDTSWAVIPINPVGLPFWYAGYYNSGCHCCENDVPCVSSNEKSRSDAVVGKKQVQHNSPR